MLYRNFLLGFVLTIAVVATASAASAASGTPFQKLFELAGSSDTCASFTVPAGHRLVVSYFAGSVVVPSGNQLHVGVSGQTASDDDEMFVSAVLARESIVPTQDR